MSHTAKNRADMDVLHLGCGEDYHADAWNVDVVADVDPDEVYNLNELPWPWAGESFSEIRAYHVFEHLDDIEAALREAVRILEPGGKLELRLPMGNDALADPDHTWGAGNQWTWRTPLFYTGERHWDIDVGLSVADRTVNIWPLHPTNAERAFWKGVWTAKLRGSGPGEWVFSLPQMSGEFRVVFEHE